MQTRAHRLGCHGMRLACRISTSTPSSRGEAADDLERVGPVGGATVAPPAVGVALPRQDRGQEQRLGGDRVEELLELGLRGPPLHAVHRGRAAVGRERDGPGLEEGDPGGAAPEVPGGGVEDPGQQRGRVERQLLGQRVGQTYGVAQHVVLGQPERVEGLAADEREAHHLHAAERGQGAPDAATQPLLAGQPATDGRDRDHGRHLVVPDDPDDLLDQVVGVGHVGSPRRWGHREGLLAGDLRADRP